MNNNKNKMLVCCAAIEISYLTLSFMLGEIYGQWSITGEMIRTLLRLVSITFYAYWYQRFFYVQKQRINTQKLFSPQFVLASSFLFLFAVFYSNAANESVAWQVVFVISGLAAGLREELFYRGIVQQSLQLKYDYKTALLFACFLFTLSHAQYIFHGQTKGLLMIALAGIIFGSVFIYTGSIAITAAIHGLYDALLSVYLSPIKLSNNVALIALLVIASMFLMLIKKQLYPHQDVLKNNDTHPDNLSMG